MGTKHVLVGLVAALCISCSGGSQPAAPGTPTPVSTSAAVPAASPSAEPSGGLSDAVRSGDIKAVEPLLTPGTLNDRGPDGRLPLALACEIGDKEMVAFLLDKGAYPDRDDDVGSPIHLAVENDHADIVELLMVHGVEVDRRNKDGKKPEEVAKDKGYTEIVELLPLREKLIDAVKKGDAKGAAAILKARPALASAHDPRSGATPLHLVTDKATAQALVAAGADLKATDSKGMTPLHWVARTFTGGGVKPEEIAGRKAAAEVLLAAGADPNARDTEMEDTPLYFANHKAIVEVLLAHGADVNARDEYNQTPIYRLVRTAGDDVITLLLSKGADPTIVTTKGQTVLMGVPSKKRAEQLVAKGVDVKAKDEDGWTALHEAAMNDNVDLVAWLLAKGADPNAMYTQGGTPLHLAAHRGHKNAVAVLLNNGAKVNAKDNEGKTPLADARGDEVKALLKKNGGTE